MDTVISTNNEEKEEEYYIPVEVKIEKEEVTAWTALDSPLLPKKSKERYNESYQAFREWQTSNECYTYSETELLAYFKYLSDKYKPSSLWAQFSMLKTTININAHINIGTYKKLLVFLKEQSVGFKSKKSKVFKSDEIENFLKEAPDCIYLAMKVACIFGVCGACRRGELTNITVEDVKNYGRILVVNIQDTETHQPRSFVVPENYFDIVNRYMNLRPNNVVTNRFFLKYLNGKCFSQVIGINKFGVFPKQVAEYLKLKDADLYTGHSFRRTSATLFANSKADMTMVERHAEWKSDPVAEEDTKESITNKRKISNSVFEEINLKDFDETNPKQKKISNISNEEITILAGGNLSLQFKNCSNVNINIYKQED